tara:strand:+ start:160 stop:393 length:234 start_codon:yes stop_codon:yes gene_type:complete
MWFNKSNPKWMIYSSMGLEVGLSVVVGFLIGTWLDEWLETAPWFLIIFGVAGIIAGYRSMFRMVKRMQSDSANGQEK